ncbi:hypothetical protein D3C83_327020 [compost metagenome]
MTGGDARIEPGVTETWTIRRTVTSVEISDSIEIRGRPSERVVVRNRVACP